MRSGSNIRTVASGVAAAVAAVGYGGTAAHALDCNDVGITWAPDQPGWTSTVTPPLSDGSDVTCTVTWGTKVSNRDSWRIDCDIENLNANTNNENECIYIHYKVNGVDQTGTFGEMENCISGSTQSYAKCATRPSGTVNNMEWQAFQGVEGGPDEAASPVSVSFVK